MKTVITILLTFIGYATFAQANLDDYKYIIVPKKFVMFTDGWPFNSWGDADYCDTIFLINNPYDRGIEAPFGMTVQYED